MPQIRPEQIIDATQDAGLTHKPAPEQTMRLNVRTPVQQHNAIQSQITGGNTELPRLFNWAKDKPDSRDYIYQIKTPSAPSAVVDLRPFCSRIEDQGYIGSCTGHAISSAMELILKRNNKMLELSRLFIYYQERLLEGTVTSDAGAYLRNGIKACNIYGAPAEDLWKYNVSNFATRPPEYAYTDALRRKVSVYRRCPNFAAVKNALQTGNPVVVGFSVYSSFLSSRTAKTGIMDYPNKKVEKALGGHAVCLVGFDDRRQVFIAKNSWGINWGDKGYFYMPYRVIQDTTMSGDFWVIDNVTS